MRANTRNYAKMKKALWGAVAGFTLIELLVVISIIAILSSILMPTFARAKEAARAVVCSSNMRQIGMALQSYGMDYDGCHPPYGYERNSQMTFYDFGRPAAVLNNYVKDKRIFLCPSFPVKNLPTGYFPEEASSEIQEFETTGYGGRPYIVRSDYSFNPAGYPSAQDYTRICENPGTAAILADYPSVPFRGDRHSGGINILFADYHVKKYMFLKARPSINSGDPSADWYNWSWHETAGTYPQWPDIP